MESVKIRYVYSEDDPRRGSFSDRYEGFCYYAKNMKGMNVSFSQIGNGIDFYFEGEIESLRRGLGVLFDTGFEPERVEVDKAQVPFNWLGKIWKGFKSSTRKGHRQAVEELERRGLMAKKWHQREGHLAYSIFELPP